MTDSNEQIISLINHGGLEQLQLMLKGLGMKSFNFEVCNGIAVGDNYEGLVASICANCRDNNDKHVSLNFIVKTIPDTKQCPNRSRKRLLFQREIYMYDTVFPEIMKLQLEKSVTFPFTSIPECYVTSLDDFREFIITKDMKSESYERKDRRVPLDFAHSLLVMREQGRFHALSFALRDQKPELFKELQENTQDLLVQTFDEDRKMFNNLLELALSNFDAFQDKAAYERLFNYKGTYEKVLTEVLKKGAAGEYDVICHGDAWICNLLFKYGDATKPSIPTEVCFLDFQLSRCSSPVLDISQFIFVCTDKDLRDQHYNTLIEEYYKSFSEHLRKLGSDPDKLFPWQILQEHLKKFSVFGFHLAVSFMHSITGENNEIEDLVSGHNRKQRLQLLRENCRKRQQYHTRVRGVVSDFMEYGYDF